MVNESRLKLLIADDEYIIRETLKRAMDWDANNVEVVGYAKNGIEATKLISEFGPDIVLTDVRMPGMDGIMLAKWINENCPHIEVIFISAYSDFDYAQGALKYGVVDYLLKPVKSTLLFEAINKIRNEINRQKMEKAEMERFKSLLTNNMPIIREKYIHDVLEGKYENDIEELFKLYDIDLRGDLYIITIISIERSSAREGDDNGQNTNYELLKLELTDLISSFIKDPYKGYIFNETKESTGIVFSVNLHCEKPHMYRGVIGILEKVREYFSEKGCILTIGISSLNSDIHSLKNCYHEALKALKARAYMGSGKVIPYSCLNMKDSRFSLETNEADNIFEHMKNLDWHNVQLSIKKYFEHYAANPDILEEHSRFMVYELVSILKRVLVYNQKSSGTVISKEEINELMKYTTLQDMSEGIISLFKKYFNLMIYQRSEGSNRVIREVKEYINKNYMNNVSLTDTAEYVFLNPSYLSKIFLKETGMLFSEYLIQCRMEKVKELLLKTDLKIYEISEKVGYHDEKHLMKMFKKVTGVSPMEYKKNRLKNPL